MTPRIDFTYRPNPKLEIRGAYHAWKRFAGDSSPVIFQTSKPLPRIFLSILERSRALGVSFCEARAMRSKEASHP